MKWQLLLKMFMAAGKYVRIDGTTNAQGGASEASTSGNIGEATNTIPVGNPEAIGHHQRGLMMIGYMLLNNLTLSRRTTTVALKSQRSFMTTLWL